MDVNRVLPTNTIGMGIPCTSTIWSKYSVTYRATVHVMRTGKKCAILVNLSSITHIESNLLTPQGNPVTKSIVICPISTREYLIFEVCQSTFDARP